MTSTPISAMSAARNLRAARVPYIRHLLFSVLLAATEGCRLSPARPPTSARSRPTPPAPFAGRQRNLATVSPSYGPGKRDGRAGLPRCPQKADSADTQISLPALNERTALDDPWIMRRSGEGRLALWSSTQRAWPALLLLLALGAVTAGTVNASAFAGPPPTARASLVESTITHCTNRARAAHGLPVLHRNRILRNAASYHARNMRRYRFFDHRDVFGQSPLDRIARFGGRRAFRRVGEN